MQIDDGVRPPGAPRYRVRLSCAAEDVARAQALRGRLFHGPGAPPDADAFDVRCTHVLVEHARSGAVVACARVMAFDDGRAAARESYSAQFYGMDALAGAARPMIEIGRFCAAPEHRDPAVLRLAWAALAVRAEALGATTLFGCASFAGAEPERHAPALGLLAARHLAPGAVQPARRAPETLAYAQALAGRPVPDPRAAYFALPPLLRGYLALGARVSDHAVIDRAMDTLHVLTLLDVAAIAPARLRQLRMDAARLVPATARGAA